MSQPVFYKDQCPSCGRPLQIGIQFLGQQVACQHCHKAFQSVGNGSVVETKMEQRIDSLLSESAIDEPLAVVEQHFPIGT